MQPVDGWPGTVAEERWPRTIKWNKSLALRDYLRARCNRTGGTGSPVGEVGPQGSDIPPTLEVWKGPEAATRIYFTYPFGIGTL